MTTTRFHEPRWPRRPRLSLIGLALALALVAAGCGKDSAEKPSVQNFARAWNITSCEYRHQTDGARRVDLVDEGWTIDLYINDDGHFFYVWTPPGGSEESYTGTWTIDGESVLLTREGASFSWEFRATVREESMTLTGAHAEYDFDDDGTPEPALWNLSGEN